MESDGQNHKFGIDVGINNQTEDPLQKIGADADRMATKVQQAGEKAAKGIEGIGDGADRAAQKLARAEGSMSKALQLASEKARIAAEAGNSVAKAFEIKLDMRGMDASKFDPVIAKIREYENALAAAKAEQAEAAGRNAFLDSLRAQTEAIGKSKSELLALKAAQLGLANEAAPYIARLREMEKAHGGVGMSAAQTAQAMRMLPMQMTDVFTSLASGMPVYMVAIQQGGQLKDSFGGVGAAAKATAGYVAGLVTPYTVAAAAVVALGAAVAYSEVKLRENNRILAQLSATGRIDVLNTESIKQLKKEMAELPGLSKGMATAIISDLVSIRTLGGDAIKGVSKLAADFAAATGQDIPAAAKELAKSLDD